MGAFVNSTITKAGVLAAAKALSGQQLTFTKIVMGDGFLSEGQTVDNLEDVINKKVTVDIVRHSVESANTAILGGVFTNQGLEDGFYWRELGLYAQDPDVGEILFSYGNSGDLAEYIPADGGNTVIEKNIDILTYVGNAANVSIYIAPDAYPTKADFDELMKKVDACTTTANEAKQIAMEARLTAQQALALVKEFGKIVDANTSKTQTLWDAVFSEVTANPWRLDFTNLDGIELVSGVWDESRARLVC